MQLALTNQGMTLSAKIQGAMDAIGVARDRDVAARILGGASEEIVLDMAEVSFMDASGLGLITYVVKRARDAGIKVTLIHVLGQPAVFLSKLGLDKVFGFEVNELAARPMDAFGVSDQAMAA